MTANDELTVEEAVMQVRLANAPDLDAWLRVLSRMPSLPERLRLDVAAMQARGASGADALAAIRALEAAGLAWEPWQPDPRAPPPLPRGRAGYVPPPPIRRGR